MSIYSLGDKDEKHNSNSQKPIKHRKKRKDERRYTEQELKELMDVNRDTYKRTNRRVRRR